jgi:adenylylsulfate kinase
VVWFTGLSGAGKSTIAHAVAVALHQKKRNSFVLDGDNVRHGLCADLGFSHEDRSENIRRVAEVSRLLMEAGVLTLSALISPLRADRERARQIVGAEKFFEIYVRCSLEVCETRDVKDMYRRARLGEIKEFTGISAPYEPPESPNLVLDTSQYDLAKCVAAVIDLIEPHLA